MAVMEGTFHTRLRIPRGIDISEPERHGSVVEKCAYANTPANNERRPSWCYLFIHHTKIAPLTDRLILDGIQHFIHKTIIYHRKRHSRGIQAIERPTISGLIFLQGTPRELQRYFNETFPNYHLVNNCSTHQPATIPDSVMQPFMRVLETSPERVRFLLHPFKYYAGGNIKLRITSGYLAGLEGYVIRIDRDRRLVMDVGGMSVAIAGIHCEKFEVVEDGQQAIPPQFHSATDSTPVRQLTPLQQKIGRDIYRPHTQQETALIADTIDLWRERAAIYQERGQAAEAKEILFFLLEEADHHSLLPQTTTTPSPILAAVRLIARQIDDMANDQRLTEDIHEEIAAERDAWLPRLGYLFEDL